MLKIYSWNVNGIRAVLKKDKLYPFLQKNDPDILALQETKAQRGQVDIEVNGYEEFWYSAEKAGYSGTAIFSKKSPISVQNGFPKNIIKQFGVAGDIYGDPNLEGRVIAAEYRDFWLVTVYTPNAKDYLSRLNLRHKQLDPAFLAYCKSLEASKPVIFTVDLNVAHNETDLANPGPTRGKKGFTTEEREGFQNFIDNGFVDTLRMFKEGNGYYTWWSHFANARARNVGWRIDYILVSESLTSKVVAADIHPDIFGSDHCPVSILLDL